MRDLPKKVVLLPLPHLKVCGSGGSTFTTATGMGMTCHGSTSIKAVARHLEQCPICASLMVEA